MKSAQILGKFAGMGLLSALLACNTIKKAYVHQVEDEFSRQTFAKEILTEKDLVKLPKTIQKYLRYTGSVGKEKVYNFRMEFMAEMYKKKDSPMISDTEQYNFFGNYSRHFYLEASMFGIPARVLHSYSDQKAAMKVRLLNLFNIVDISGEEISKTETLTVLNDLCFFAPAALIDKRISFEEISPLETKIFFQNGHHKVSAILYFKENGELVNFTTMERGALQDDGTMKYVKWSTPISEYKNFSDRMIPTYGEAINHFPEGDFVYGKFHLRAIEYNVPARREKVFYAK